MSLTNKRKTLALGILFVGFVDILSILIQYFNDIFSESNSNAYLQNILVMIMIVVVFGFLDVLIFTVPLFDLFKKFKSDEEGHKNNPSMVKLAKIYIIPHFIITPFNIAIIFMIKDLKDFEITIALGNKLFFIQLLLNLWFCGIITRGINTIYDFNPLYKRFIFIVVYVWTFLFGYASQIILGDWILGFLI
jgi:hypothetical protein